MYAYTRPRQQGSQANTSEASRQAVVQSHTAALSYPAESADIASEYSIGLCATQTQLTVYNVSNGAFWLSRFGS
jgi:hypothetical protein